MSRDAIGRGHGIFKAIAVIFIAAACLAEESPAFADPSERKLADTLVRLLGEKFAPESLEVTVAGGRAYAEMRGVVLSGIRIDAMKLDALLVDAGRVEAADVSSLASLIGYSRGELVLLERDVNAYFDSNDTRGFSNLAFDFSNGGFRANGIFTASFLFTFRIRLAASGRLALRANGVDLDGVAIYVENIEQPASLTDKILSRVNPLIKWDSIPFRVAFKDIFMDDVSAVMTGYPERIESGETAAWEEGVVR
ncbi:MAG: hypothetical protein LBS75_08750 [Synergistaceae bacterium]|jgi:hypothetical protein|nr:hypothetical protein [Synergistaceae bacterium]